MVEHPTGRRAPPSPELLADLRTGRQPVTGHEDPGGDLRVFAIQYRIDLAHAASVEAYRDAMGRLVQDLVLPHVVPGRPTLVVFPEIVGLLTLAIGERGSALRARAAEPIAPPIDDVPAALLGAMEALREASADRIDAYVERFGDIDPRTALYLAATDTAARAFSQTFSTLARDHGMWVVASNYQAPYVETRDPAEVAAFGIAGDDVAYLATTPHIPNATFLWGPDDVDPDAPTGETNLLARNEKVPLTEMEALLGFVEGPADGDGGRRNAGWTEVAGFRVGFATSLPAFTYGYPFAERPDDLDPLADLRGSYAAAQDALGVDVMIQADANGPWAVDVASGAWQPLEWMGSTWRAVADPTVGFRYNVTPMMVGNLLDLMFDGQSSITARGHTGAGTHFVGNAERGPQDPARYQVYAGDKPELLAVAPWLVTDAPRDQLRAISDALSPGSGSAIENAYVETAIFADLRLDGGDACS